MARTSNLWKTGTGGTYIQTITPNGYDLLINGSDHYINFGTTVGTGGYGIRDNGGTMEFKDSSGAWTSFAGGTAGVSSLNGLTGGVILAAGTGITLTPVGNTITITATGGGTGTVTSVGWTGGIVSIATATTTPAFTIAGTSGGIPYFSSASTWASSAALAANAIVIGGGAGVAPSTTTTAAGILTFLGTPTSANLKTAVTDETGSGALVFATSPTLVTPVLGAATYTTLSGGAITDSALTAGRVTFAGTAGLLSDDSSFTWDNTNKVLKLGTGTPTYTIGANNDIAMTSSINSYYAAELQNLSAGTTASTDFVINADNGTDTTNYLDIGIASSGNTDPLYTFAGAGEAYMYSASSSIAYGTASANKVHRFYTGGTLTANLRITINDNGILLADNTHIQIPIPTTDLTGTGNVTSAFNCGYTSSAIGDLVYLDSSSTWQKADMSTSATTKQGMLAIALEVKASGAALKVALPGSFVYSTTGFPTWTIGDPIYMSTAGAMTQTLPVATDNGERVIGWAVHADKMYFYPESGYQTHT